MRAAARHRRSDPAPARPRPLGDPLRRSSRRSGWRWRSRSLSRATSRRSRPASWSSTTTAATSPRSSSTTFSGRSSRPASSNSPRSPTRRPRRGGPGPASAGAAIIIPAGFSEAIEAGQPTEVRLLGGECPISLELARSVVEPVREHHRRDPAADRDQRRERRAGGCGHDRRSPGRGRRAASRSRPGHGPRIPPGQPADVLRRGDGDHVRVLRDPVRRARPARRSAGRDDEPAPGRADPARRDPPRRVARRLRPRARLDDRAVARDDRCSRARAGARRRWS